MSETLIPYSADIIDSNVISIFNSLKNSRIKTIENGLTNLKSKIEA